MKNLTMQLEQLACPTCAQKIETVLKNVPGVVEAQIFFNSSKAKISFDESKAQPETLAAAVRSLGYDVLKLS